MKKIFRIVLILLAIIFITAVGCFIYLKSSLTPTYQGELTLEGLAEEVTVYYTDHGIPHLYASSEKDAFYALGYVHAQDRLFQMDLLRHVGSGTLSELFGKDLIDTDKYLRTIGVSTYAASSAEAYLNRNDASLPMLQAYLEGINHYVATNPKPLEHLILGLEVAPFDVQDVFETLAYMTFSFQHAQATDPVFTQLYATLDSAYLKDLSLYHYPGEVMIQNYDQRYAELANNATAHLNRLGVPIFVGSNSWVVSPRKSKTGSVILENDPHIGFAQPAVWYEAHMTMPGKEYYGYHIAGVPFPLLMHTPTLANGLTMFENDDMDFFIEEIHPEDSNQYRFKDEWLEMDARTEIINVKDAQDVTFSVRSTIHGPIVSDILMDEPLNDVVSSYWTTAHFPNYNMEVLYAFSNAQRLEDIEKAASRINGPGLNVMYGDKAGNIAWWASAKLIKRPNEATSKTFYDGSNMAYHPDSTFGFDKNPHAVNPPWEYVYSANNQPDTVDGVLYSGYYLPDDRGERIVELLTSQDKLDVEGMKAMTLDEQSNTFEAIQSILLEAIDGQTDVALVNTLKDWDATFDRNAYAPLIYHHWVFNMLEMTMLDEIGDTSLWKGLKSTHPFKASIEPLILNEGSSWWDNVMTEEKETREHIIVAAFTKTMEQLKEQWGAEYEAWKWGDAHTLTHNHAMGSALSFLNVGPFAVSGGNEVLNNMGLTWSNNKTLPVIFGPSTRRVIDFSDVRNNSWGILPTGQSGNFFSPYYDDQAELFATGKFRKMLMNEDEIRQSENKLALTPAK